MFVFANQKVSLKCASLDEKFIYQSIGVKKCQPLTKWSETFKALVSNFSQEKFDYIF